MSLIIGILVVIILFYIFTMAVPIILFGLTLYAVYMGVIHIRKIKYFNSDDFKAHKKEVELLTEEYNNISKYVNEISLNSKFEQLDKNKNEHLAVSINTSKHNYVRDRKKKMYDDNVKVHSCSLSVVRNAEKKPMRYVSKYFGIEENKKSLRQLKMMEENISNSKNAILNLEKRAKSIKDNIRPPKFILRHFEKELMEQLGVNIPDIEIEYEKYVFEYISPGGNSAQRTEVEFNIEAINSMIEYISNRIEHNNSVKKQRALMTEKLRRKIKERDNYTCQNCSASIKEQSLLLLEIDHIIPVSKGGKSVEENLQTLCWKCNREKGTKIY